MDKAYGSDPYPTETGGRRREWGNVHSRAAAGFARLAKEATEPGPYASAMKGVVFEHFMRDRRLAQLRHEGGGEEDGGDVGGDALRRSERGGGWGHGGGRGGRGQGVLGGRREGQRAFREAIGEGADDGGRRGGAENVYTVAE